MKKYFLFLLSLLLLTSCWPNQTDVEKAKQEMLWWSGEILESYTEDAIPAVNVEEPKQGDFLSIDPIDASNISPEEVQITGKVLNPEVEKIIVNFKNSTSAYPSDQYTLKNFKKGDTTFKYIASSKFRVLDYGTNEYTFVAYASGTISEAKMLVNVPENSSLSSSGGVQNSREILTSLPKSTSYGEPIFISDETFTYSQLKWLEVKRESVPVLSCVDSQFLTDFLVKKYWYTYWNTCRDIALGKSLRVNVVRLDGQNKFIYETHIIDSYNQLYGTYFFASGSGSKDTLEAINNEFKSQEQKWVDVVGLLFKDMAK
jgi:hypothetical protein